MNMLRVCIETLWSPSHGMRPRSCDERG